MISADAIAERPAPARDMSARSRAVKGSAILFTFVLAFAAVEWLRALSLPAAAAGFGLLALAACFLLPVADRRTAAALPALAAVAALRLVDVALLPASAPPYRYLVVAVPTLVGAGALVRAMSSRSVAGRRVERVERP